MTEDLLQRVPPQNIEAEQAALGSVIVYPAQFDAVSEIITAADFYRESHGLLWKGIDALARARRPIDAIHLTEACRPDLEAIGGAGYIAELAAGLWVSSLAIDYARIVKEKSIQRQLASAAIEIATTAYQAPSQWSPDWTEEQIAGAEYEIARIASQLIRKPEPKKAELLSNVLYDLEHRISHSVKTGFPKVDHSFGGFNVGHLTILAARTSKGKSAFALNVAINAARAKFPVAFFTLEMTAEETWERALACVAQVDTFLARRRELRDSERGRLEQARRELEQLPLSILYRPSMRPRDFRIECRRLAREMTGGLKLAIVDYLGLARGDHHERERWREMQEAVLALKAIAGELGIPILLLSQLNRDAAKDETHPPSLATLRDTGCSEEHASNVLFLWQKPVESESPPPYGEPEDIELIIAKQRNGPSGLRIPLKFNKSWGGFFDWR